MKKTGLLDGPSKESPSIVIARRLLSEMAYMVGTSLQFELVGGNIPKDIDERFVFAFRAPRISVLISNKAADRSSFVDNCRKLHKIHHTNWSLFELSVDNIPDLNCHKGDLKIIVCSHDEFPVIQELVRVQRSEGSVKVTTGVQYFRDFYKEWIDSKLQ